MLHVEEEKRIHHNDKIIDIDNEAYYLVSITYDEAKSMSKARNYTSFLEGQHNECVCEPTHSVQNLKNHERLLRACVYKITVNIVRGILLALEDCRRTEKAMSYLGDCVELLLNSR